MCGLHLVEVVKTERMILKFVRVIAVVSIVVVGVLVGVRAMRGSQMVLFMYGPVFVCGCKGFAVLTIFNNKNCIIV